MTLDEQYEATCQQDTDIKDHLPTLKHYASLCGHVTEFGVRYGTSTIALIAGHPKKVVSYDTYRLVDTSVFERFASQNGTEFKFVQENVLLAVIEPTDFLFIDTIHNYGQLTAELARHWDKVRRFLAFHDTMSYSRHGMDGRPLGIMDALEDFLKIHPEWSLVHSSDICYGFQVYERQAS